METIIIGRSRKAIRTYLLILFIVGLPFFCIFLNAYVDPVHNEDRSNSIFFITLLNLLWIGPFAYLLNKLYNSYKPEIILTKEGIEFKDKKSYNWEDVISYRSQIYTTSGGGDGSEIDLETLFIYLFIYLFILVTGQGKVFVLPNFHLIKQLKKFSSFLTNIK